MLSREFLEIHADPCDRDATATVASQRATARVEAASTDVRAFAALGRLLLWPSFACIAIVRWALLMAFADRA